MCRRAGSSNLISEALLQKWSLKCWLQTCLRWQSRCHLMARNDFYCLGHKGWRFPKRIYHAASISSETLSNWCFSYYNNFISLNTITFLVGAPVFTKLNLYYIPPIYWLTELWVHIRNGGPFQYFRLCAGMMITRINKFFVNRDKSSILLRTSPKGEMGITNVTHV